MRVQSINCNKYFILSIDDYSIMTSVQFLKHKSEIFDMFKVFKNQVENQIGRIIKCIRSDGGGDFISDEFIEYYEKYDIRKKISMARTPQQNEVIEKKNRIVQEMTRTMLIESKVAIKF